MDYVENRPESSSGGQGSVENIVDCVESRCFSADGCNNKPELVPSTVQWSYYSNMTNSRGGQPKMNGTTREIVGIIEFSPITFMEPGVYSYEIRELTPSSACWETDARVFRVIVTVIQNAHGELEATAEYPDGYPEFRNVFKDGKRVRCYCKSVGWVPKLELVCCTESCEREDSNELQSNA